MNKDVFMDAVGYLDTDILAKHLQEKKGLRQQPKLNISEMSEIQIQK